MGQATQEVLPVADVVEVEVRPAFLCLEAQEGPARRSVGQRRGHEADVEADVLPPDGVDGPSPAVGSVVEDQAEVPLSEPGVGRRVIAHAAPLGAGEAESRLGPLPQALIGDHSTSGHEA